MWVITRGEKMSEKNYRLDDSVLHRVVQIVQEGFMLGIDVADLMRQIRLTVDSTTDDTVLVLHPQYVSQVAEMHKKYLEEAERLKSHAENVTPLVFES